MVQLLALFEKKPGIAKQPVENSNLKKISIPAEGFKRIRG